MKLCGCVHYGKMEWAEIENMIVSYHPGRIHIPASLGQLCGFTRRDALGSFVFHTLQMINRSSSTQSHFTGLHLKHQMWLEVETEWPYRTVKDSAICSKILQQRGCPSNHEQITSLNKPSPVLLIFYSWNSINCKHTAASSTMVCSS